MEGGKLYDNHNEKLEMNPVGPAHLYGPKFGIDYEFTSRPEGGMAVKITQGGHVIEGVRGAFVPDVPSTSKDFPQYAGVYWSRARGPSTRCRCGLETRRRPPTRQFELTPSTKDRFTTTLWFIPKVRRDHAPVDGAMFGGYRTKYDFVRR